MAAGNPVSEEVLRDIVQRIVEVAQPEKIILFGSAARGEMTRHSDVDLLVIKRGPFHQGRLTGEIYMRLIGVGHAIDVLLTTPEEVERLGHCRALVVSSILQEGRIVYGH